jgi:putative PIN family toxin of toxin-antitoxin system
LDTNIFVRATISSSGINAQLLDLWKRDRFVLVLSKDIVEEILEVLLRPRLINRYPYSQKDVETLANLINQKAVIITPEISFDYCRDPDDNKFITCAIVGRAQYLVSGDDDLIDEKQL